MAVEIPVVVDIEGAFKDAAKRAPKAVEPLKKSIEGLNEDLAFWREQLDKSVIGSNDFKMAAKEIQNISQAMQIANREFVNYSSNEGSIRKMSNELAFLNEQWEAMGASEKYAANGALSADAQAIWNNYKRVTEELQKSGKSLSQMAAEEQKVLELAKKRAELSAKGAQKRQYENAIMNASVKTIRVLTEQERILSERIGRTVIGTDKYKKLASDLRNVRKELAEARAQIDGTSSSMGKMAASARNASSSIEATNASLTKQSVVLSQIRSMAGMYISIFGAIRFARNIRETTAELEMQRVALGGIVQDTEIAGKLFREIKAAALKSPFEIKDLVTYTKQLSAYRIETSKLFDVTMRLADVSAGLGVDMNRLILAYGQVRAASVLRGQELRQFTEAGIPLVELLAEKFRELGREGTTTADVFELISKRAVPFSMIEDIFNDMTDAGGIFYNMQEKQSETLKGQWMKLRDAATIMYDEIGNTEEIHKAMEALVKDLIRLTNSWKETARWIGAGIAAMTTYSVVAKASALASGALTKAEAARLAVTKAQTVVMPKFLASILGETAAKKISHKVTRTLTVAQYRLATATTVAEKAFWKFYAAIIRNPYALAAAGVIALAASIYTLVRNSREAEVSVDSLQKSLSGWQNQVKKSGDVERLVDTYEELSNKAERTKQEQEKLDRVTRELAKTFPTAVSGIDKETDALKINIEKVKELTKAEIKLKEERLKRESGRAIKEIGKLEKERNDILAKVEAGGEYIQSAGGAMIFRPLTDKQWIKYSERVEEINTKLQELKSTEEEVLDALFVGPMPDTTPSAEKVSKVWKETLRKIQKEKADAGASVLFTPSDIDGLKDVSDLYKKVKKNIEDTSTSLASLRALQKTLVDEDALKSNQLSIEQAEKDLDLLETLKTVFGFVFKSAGGSYQQDPFIAQMQNRIKFMQDFKKGYDDLRKYLGPEGALGKISETMLGRGQSLGLDAAQQQRAATDLSSWYDEMIKMVEAKLRAKGVSGVRTSDLLGFDTTKRGKDVQDLQKLLQSLWDAKTDFDTSEVKRKIDEALKKLSDEIKRSETARNFFENILGLTGDEDLAANMAISIYGDPGNDLAQRIKDSIQGAMKSEHIGEDNPIWGELMKAAEDLDFRDIMSKISDLPEGVQNAVKEAASAIEKHNVDIANSYAKLLLEYDELEKQRVDIENEANQKIKTLRDGLAQEIQGINENAGIKDKEAAIAAARARVAAVQAGIEKEVELQQSRLEKDYRLFFSSVGVITEESARKVAAKQKKMLTEQFETTGMSFSRYKRELKEINDQLAQYTNNQGLFRTFLSGGFEGITNKFGQFADNLRAISHNIRDNGGVSGIFALDDETMEYIDKIGSIMGGSAFGVAGVSGRRNVAQQLVTAIAEMSENAEDFKKNMQNALDYAAEGADGFAASFSQGLSTAGFWVKNVSTLIKELDQFNQSSGKTPKWLDVLASTVTWTLGVGGDEAWDRLANLNEYATSGFEKLSQGNIVGAIADNVRGLIAFWGPNIKRIERDIKDQDRLIEDLDYQYGRLENSIQKAFGSDYITNYNKQLETLYAQQEAYLKQAELERSKGNKSDEERIKEYEKQARNTGDQIQDMQSQLSEFFSGTDLTSAAKDFANAWIEAYKEYGSVTTAMKEKFQDMVQSMVENSLAARVMQDFLRPIFDEIDRLSQEGSELSTTDIAAIAEMANAVIPNINDAMTTLMNTLAAGGYNVRQQAGQFTGIKRDIANASEESINGLTQATNVNNFYVQSIAQSVAQILAIMSGGTTEQPNAGTHALFNNELALQYMSALPNIDLNMAELLRCVKSVISDKNFETNSSVIAVRA